MDIDPNPPGADKQARKTRSLGRYLRKLRTALRLRTSNKAPKPPLVANPGALRDPGQSHTAPPVPIHGAQDQETVDAKIEARPASPLNKPDGSLVPEQREGINVEPQAASLLRSNSNPLPVQEYRARRAAELFEKYGIDPDPEICPYGNRPATTGNIERVDKPIRMRIHHHCHHCSLAIGPAGVCVNCGHKLCKKCQRYPESKEIKIGDSKERKRKASPTRSETLENWLASVPSTPSTLALRPAANMAPSVTLLRRVRRLCHQCTAPFIWTERVCQDCDHEMCSECPIEHPSEATEISPDPNLVPSRQPFLQKDRIFKKPRLRVRYYCDKCNSLMQERTDFCSRCGHLRCSSCVRNPPWRGPPAEPSPEVLCSLHRRLAAVKVPLEAAPPDNSSTATPSIYHS